VGANPLRKVAVGRRVPSGMKLMCSGPLWERSDPTIKVAGKFSVCTGKNNAAVNAAVKANQDHGPSIFLSACL
jgi:hypothetical protein